MRRTYIPQAGFEPRIPVFKESETICALGSAATGIDIILIDIIIIIIIIIII